MKKIFIVLHADLFRVCTHKIFRIMKLTYFLLFFTIINAFSSSTYSQYTKLNLEMEDVPIQTVLSAIEGQSEFFFLYSSKMIDVTRKVDIKAEGQSVYEIMDKLFAATDIKYTVRDRQILLVNKEAETVVMPVQRRITGRITDENGVTCSGGKCYSERVNCRGDN